MRATQCAGSLLAAVALAGCAAPPERDAHYDAALQRVVRSAASIEVDQPVTLPEEPAIDGVHPVAFYVMLALERNPEILAAQRAVAAETQRIPQVTSLEDPMLMDTFQPIASNSLQTAAGRAPNTLSLTQRFPWMGKLRIRGEIAEQQAKIALTNLAEAQLNVTEQVHLAYFELAYAQWAIEATEQDAALLERLLEIAQARYSTGQSSQQDVLLAQVELYKLNDRLIALRRQLQQAQADLAQLVHTNPGAELLAETQTPVPDVPTEVHALYQAAVRCRPELQERLHAIIEAQRAVDLAELQYYPDFTAGIGWQAVTAENAVSRAANGNDNVMFTLGMSLPVWQDKLRAGVHEAQLRTVERSLRYDAARDDAFRTIRRLMVQLQTLDQQIALYRDYIIPKAEQTLRVSTADYRVGRVDFQQIIDNWSTLLMFHIQLARLEANLAQALASLERAVGCQLAEIPQALPADALPPNAPIPAEPPSVDVPGTGSDDAPADRSSVDPSS